MNTEYYLQRFYNSVYDNVLIDNQIKLLKESIFITVLNMSNVACSRLLDSSALSSENLPDLILSDLLQSHLIRPTNDLNLFSITAKGVWLIERRTGVLSEESLVSFLDGKYFDLFLAKKNLNEKEKIILLAMISVRSFSKESAIDLNRDEYVLDAWKRIIESSFEKLNSLKIVTKMSRKNIFPKSGNEHIVARLMRQTTNLKKKTKGLFTSAGDYCFYLNLFSVNQLQKSSLLFLLKAIFNSRKGITASDFEGISSFCSDTAYSETAYLFDIDKHIFSSPEFDVIVNDALKEAVFFA